MEHANIFSCVYVKALISLDIQEINQRGYLWGRSRWDLGGWGKARVFKLYSFYVILDFWFWTKSFFFFFFKNEDLHNRKCDFGGCEWGLFTGRLHLKVRGQGPCCETGIPKFQKNLLWCHSIATGRSGSPLMVNLTSLEKNHFYIPGGGGMGRDWLLSTRG